MMNRACRWKRSLLVVLVSLGWVHGSHAATDFGSELASAALERTSHRVRYDPAYVYLSFPGGDVPANRGVCTDVVVRSYRRLGIDLQWLVHLDMRSNFHLYPNLEKWDRDEADPNIDHRRVLNLHTFFSRHGTVLPITDKPEDYRPGDLVTTTVPPDLPHIAIVSNRKSADGERYLIVHNIGKGPELEDSLFEFPINGHFRFDNTHSATFPTPRSIPLPKSRLSSRSSLSLFADDRL